MAERRWSIKAYNTFLKRAKAKGLSYQQGRIAYRQMRGRLGRPAFASDMKDHRREWNEITKELVNERKQAQDLLEFLEGEDAPEHIQTLVERHEGESGYDFLVEEGILKVSISTTKTKKKFSVRL